MNEAGIDLERLGVFETDSSSETLHLDADVAKLNGLIDQWLSYLKQNILHDFIQNKNKAIQMKQQQIEFQEQRHRNEILKLQSEIRTLKKETNLHQNEICETSDDIRQGTLQHCTNKKKSCKDLLAQALLSERKKNRTIKLFYKWRSMCKNKSINRHCKQHADKDYGRNLPQGMRRISEIKTEEGLDEDTREINEPNPQVTMPYETLDQILAEEATNERYSAGNDDDAQNKDVDESITDPTESRKEICLNDFTYLSKHREYMELNRNPISNGSVNDRTESCDNGQMINLATVTPSSVTFDSNAHDTAVDEGCSFRTDTNCTVVIDHVKNNIEINASQNRESGKPVSSGLMLNVDRLRHRRKKATPHRNPFPMSTGQKVTSQRPQKLIVKRSISTIFKCSRCDKEFKVKSRLRDHQINVHNQSSEHHCIKCDKYFPYASKLKDHMSYHEGIRSYRCHMCPKGFCRKNDLDVHMKTHTRGNSRLYTGRNITNSLEMLHK